MLTQCKLKERIQEAGNQNILSTWLIVYLCLLCALCVSERYCVYCCYFGNAVQTRNKPIIQLTNEYLDEMFFSF